MKKFVILLKGTKQILIEGKSSYAYAFKLLKKQVNKVRKECVLIWGKETVHLGLFNRTNEELPKDLF